MAKTIVWHCDRCFIRAPTGPHNLPDGWCVLAPSGAVVEGSSLDVTTLLLCKECGAAFESFMLEIEKAAKPDEFEGSPSAALSTKP